MDEVTEERGGQYRLKWKPRPVPLGLETHPHGSVPTLTSLAPSMNSSSLQAFYPLPVGFPTTSFLPAGGSPSDPLTSLLVDCPPIPIIMI